MKSDKVYLEQILDSVRKISSFTAGLTKDTFILDQKTQSATILQLMLIGELVKKISENTKSKSTLPWRDITGFRDRAIHDYFDVDLDIVWNTIQTDLKILRLEIEKLV